MNIKHVAIFAALVIPIAIFGLNYSGFCLAEKTWLSDQEIISKQIERINSLSSVKLSEPNSGTVSYRPSAYKNNDEFLAKNQNCCSVNEVVQGKEIVPKNFIAQILGEYKAPVKINYILNYFNNRQEILQKKVELYFAVDNCGNVVDWEKYNEKYED